MSATRTESKGQTVPKSEVGTDTNAKQKLGWGEGKKGGGGKGGGELRNKNLWLLFSGGENELKNWLRNSKNQLGNREEKRKWQMRNFSNVPKPKVNKFLLSEWIGFLYHSKLVLFYRGKFVFSIIVNWFFIVENWFTLSYLSDSLYRSRLVFFIIVIFFYYTQMVLSIVVNWSLFHSK